jgi:hypothetical protein
VNDTQVRPEVVDAIVNAMMDAARTRPDININETASAIFTIASRAVTVLRGMGANMAPIALVLQDMLAECGQATPQVPRAPGSRWMH